MSAVILRNSVNLLHYAKRYACNSTITLNTTKYSGCRTFAADATTATGKKEETPTATLSKADIELLKNLKNKFNDEIQAGKVVPVFKRALYHANRIAVKDENGEFSYHQIYSGATALAAEISDICGRSIFLSFFFLFWFCYQ